MVEKIINNTLGKHYDKYLSLKQIGREKRYEMQTEGTLIEIMKNYLSDSKNIRFRRIDKKENTNMFTMLTYENIDDLCNRIDLNLVNVMDEKIQLKTYMGKNNFHHTLIYKSPDKKTQILCTGIEDHTLTYKQKQQQKNK